MKWPATLLAATVTMVALDLVFLGVVAKPLFDEALGPLRAPQVNWVAAAAFYVMYMTFVLRFAVGDASTVRDAARRGAGMGFFAYATYELTNWAVLNDWAAFVVPVDIAWGTVLTASVAAVGRATLERFDG